MVLNSTRLDSRLKKKHNTLAFHKVREAIAAGITQVAHVLSSENLVDLFTKSLSAPKRKTLLGGLMHINALHD